MFVKFWPPNAKMILLRKTAKSVTKICIHKFLHPSSTPKVDFGDKKCCWNHWVLVTNSRHRYHLEFKVLEDSRISYFRMFGMTILIFIVFMKRKKVQKEKSLFFRSNHRYFCRLPTLSVQCTTAPIIFCVPGIPDLEDKVYFLRNHKAF